MKSGYGGRKKKKENTKSGVKEWKAIYNDGRIISKKQNIRSQKLRQISTNLKIWLLMQGQMNMLIELEDGLRRTIKKFEKLGSLYRNGKEKYTLLEVS